MPALSRDRVLYWLTWPAAFWIAYVFTRYLPDKLEASAGSVWLFQTLADWLWISAYERPFRLGVAAAEIIASVLVILPFTRMWGAALSFGIITGAIFFHVASPVGIDPFEDGAGLFKEAVSVWFASAFILFVLRDDVRAVLNRFGILPASAPATR
jgi:uncharacterized membrane protein YphA (DoxX/SURF4 family)